VIILHRESCVVVLHGVLLGGSVGCSLYMELARASRQSGYMS
jgi:hypothetical protein